jgi:hypothetical protein
MVCQRHVFHQFSLDDVYRIRHVIFKCFVLIYTMHVITDPETIHVENIKVKKPCNLGTKQIYNLFYAEGVGRESEFVIQTPVMVLPYGATCSADDPLTDVRFDCCCDAFVLSMERVRDAVIARVVQSGIDLSNKHHVDQIAAKAFGKVLRCRLPDCRQLCFYDERGCELPCERGGKLGRHSRIQLIVQLRWFWVSREFYGLDHNILQVKLYLPPRTNMFSLPPDAHEKYHKMLKLSIPMPAVEGKMRLDGLLQADIDAFKRGLHEKREVPTGAAVATDADAAAATPNRPALSFLSQLRSQDFSLKKPGKQTATRVLKFVDTNIKVPKLAEIMDARRALKKTDRKMSV